MLHKEFPSDFRQIRYFTLLIVQSAPPDIKEINLLEQQISEIIKNAVKHGNKCDPEKMVRVWYDFSPEHAHLIVEDEGPGFQDLERWNEFNHRRQELSRATTSRPSPITFPSGASARTTTTGATPSSPRSSTGTAASCSTPSATASPCSSDSPRSEGVSRSRNDLGPPPSIGRRKGPSTGLP